MRDVALIIVVLIAAGAALRRPWIGVLLWTWLSLMNPHRYTWGFAHDAPLAAIAAVATLVGLLITRDRGSPFKGAPVVWLALLMVWITLSWWFGLDREADYAQWDKVMKIDLMVLVALALLYSKQHILAFAWVVTMSLAILGMKGGFFTIINAGNQRVWGPPGSFIADNNQFALAIVMTIPLLRFLQLQLEQGWKRHAMTAAMVLCAASALGSHSRGALLAISAMALVLWWRGRNRFVGFVAIASIGAALVAFMPEHWEERMSTIGTYQEDRSAMLRISAWWTAWGIAKDYPLGVGFNADRPELFALYSPTPDLTTGPHSIYFQILGNHGFAGLFLFLGMLVTTMYQAGRLRTEAARIPQAQWCEQLASMCQVSLVGYMVGGAFLSLAYFDLPYNVMVMVVLARVWVRRQAWKTEPEAAPRWYRMLGLEAGRRPA